jgi:ribosomal protein S18 acetylase RimI-like enzyme
VLTMSCCCATKVPLLASEFFAFAGGSARELSQADVPNLQTFFVANSGYSWMASGRAPSETEAQEEFDSLPPADMPYERRLMLGFFADTGELLGMCSLLGDFLAPRVWHIGLFTIAESRHGSGLAQAAYQALEGWISQQGAVWIRLGILTQNTRAYRFWLAQGFEVVRLRHDVVYGDKNNSLYVAAKCLAGNSLAYYLRQVPRDVPPT